MRIWLFASALAASTLICGSAQLLQEFDWRSLAEKKQVPGGSVVVVEGKSVLAISNTNAAPISVRVLNIDRPPVTRKAYAILGSVKYQGVRGDGYLEMWNYFPPVKAGLPEGAYFSRTLAAGGEMGKLTGSSGWRSFMLPFDRTGTSNAPTRLEMNVYLPAEGTVYLSPLRLVESARGIWSLSASSAGAWWSEPTGGLIGGIGGAGMGCFAGVLGWLAARGRSRGFVLLSLQILIGLGGVSLIVGIAAVCAHQPYGVWFVLLLLGVLLTGILPFRLVQYRRQYDLLELRRMSSLDAMGG